MDVFVAHEIYCHYNFLIKKKTKYKQANNHQKESKPCKNETVAWICSSLHIGQLCNVYVLGQNVLSITCHFLSVPQSICNMRTLRMNHVVKEELQYLKPMSTNCQIQ